MTTSKSLGTFVDRSALETRSSKQRENDQKKSKRSFLSLSKNFTIKKRNIGT